MVMTVNGPVEAARMGYTLTARAYHGRLIGAREIQQSRYQADEVF